MDREGDRARVESNMQDRVHRLDKNPRIMALGLKL